MFNRLLNAQYVLSSKRLPWIDYAKGIAIILVVYRHVLIGFLRSGLDVSQYLVSANEVVMSFRMPLFFIISGIFIERSLAKRSVQQFVRSKFNTILYPYFIWATVQVTLQVLLSPYTNANRGWIDYLYILIHPRGIDQFWFLYALFNATVLYALLSKYVSANNIHHLVLSLVFYYLSRFVQEYGLIHDLLYYYVFLVTGTLASKFILNKDNFALLASSRFALVMLPIFLLTQWYWLNTPDIDPFLFAAVALIGCFFMVNISFILHKTERVQILRVVGYHSLYIYILHVLITSAIRIFAIKVGVTYTPVLLVINITLGTFLPIVFYNYVRSKGLYYLFELKDRQPEQVDGKRKASSY